MFRAKQITAGMVYLGQNQILHRDLSLRNVLVSQVEGGRYQVKVGDFDILSCNLVVVPAMSFFLTHGSSLSRKTEYGYYESDSKEIPVRWSAVEVLEYGKYSS